MKTCAFTGHRPQSLPFGFDENNIGCVRLKEKLREQILFKIENEGVRRFLSGMALGTDLFAAKIVIQLRESYPDISLFAIIPCASQPSKWSSFQQERYKNVLRLCEHAIVLQKEYTSNCMRKRNEYLIDHADCIIAVWDGSLSGTGQTVQLAKQKGISITALNPQTLEVSYL